jgi:16S rRNA (cytosine967-C5)-methyltransferase
MRQESIIGHVVQAFVLFAERSHIPADAILRDYFAGKKYLGASDRRNIAIPYYRIIKNYRRLEAIFLHAWKRQEIVPELIVAADMLVFENKAPEEVRTIIANLQNEFARDYPYELYVEMADTKAAAKRLEILPKSERLSIYYSMPLWFVEALSSEYDEDETEKIVAALNDEAPTNIRVNSLVTTREKLAEIFEQTGVAATLSTFSADCITLSKRINAMDYPAFRQGAFEIQDEASQLVAPFAKLDIPKPRIFDPCCGAGGKALHFASLSKNKGDIFATDIDARKLEQFRLRLKRSTAQNIRMTHPQDCEKVLADKKNWFDVVLLDVPCSGTGTLRRNPSIKWNLTRVMHDRLIEKQREIINENINYVKPGGVLLYATCSLLKSESEEQAIWIAEHFPEFSIEEEIRTRPDKEGCDGFYAARLRKEN